MDVPSGDCLIIQGFVDGSPDDRITFSDERWHTISFIQIVPDKFVENFELSKWSDKARKELAITQRKQYKLEFLRWLYWKLQNGEISCRCFSFKDNEIKDKVESILNNFRIGSYISESAGSIHVQFPGKISVSVAKEEFSYILVLAEVMGTIMLEGKNQSVRKSDEMPIFHLVTIDKIKGDCKEKQRNEELLKEILNNVGLSGLDLRMNIESDVLVGDLLADNISGWLNKAISDESSLPNGFVRVVKEKNVLGFYWHVFNGSQWSDWKDRPEFSKEVTKKTYRKLRIMV